MDKLKKRIQELESERDKESAPTLCLRKDQKSPKTRVKKRDEGLTPKQKLAKERKEKIARKKTEAALARLIAPDPEPSESDDLSEVEQGVTTAILSTLKKKDGTPLEKSESPKGPKTRARASKKNQK